MRSSFKKDCLKDCQEERETISISDCEFFLLCSSCTLPTQHPLLYRVIEMSNVV